MTWESPTFYDLPDILLRSQELDKYISHPPNHLRAKISRIVRFRLFVCYGLAGSQTVPTRLRAICLSEHPKSMSPRAIRRAERKARKLELKSAALGAKATREDEAAVFSGPKIQANVAAEHKAKKLELKCASAPDFRETLDWAAEPNTPQLSEARLSANRANAQLSTGPTSETGKTKSSLNAVKTGLTGRTVLLHFDDAEAYRQHIAAYEKEYQPIGLRECELVQSLADTQWRLNRIPGLEMAIYAQGRIEFAGAFNEHHPDLRASMVELQTHINYEKQLRNLQLQEARLARRYEKEASELRNLQKERKAREEKTAAAAKTAQPARAASAPLGFEFSTADFITPLAAEAIVSKAILPVSSQSEHLS